MTAVRARTQAAAAVAGLAAIASGCLGSGSPAPTRSTPATRVTVSYPADGVRVHRQLACTPPAGDYPDPAAACAALRDFDRALRRPLPARATACGCIVPVGPIGAVVGRLDGQAVYLPLAWWVPHAGRDIYVLTGQRSRACAIAATTRSRSGSCWPAAAATTHSGSPPPGSKTETAPSASATSSIPAARSHSLMPHS